MDTANEAMAWLAMYAALGAVALIAGIITYALRDLCRMWREAKRASAIEQTMRNDALVRYHRNALAEYEQMHGRHYDRYH